MEQFDNTFLPLFSTHPGSVLKRELESRGIKHKAFAKSLGIPVSSLNDILRGRCGISEDIAIKLKEILGTPSQTWMNLQKRYEYIINKRNL